MSDRKSERRGGSGSSGRPSASSLTDAVVAALAEVEKSQSEARIPAEAKALIAKAPETAAEKSAAAASPGALVEKSTREDTAPFEREDPTQKTRAVEPTQAGAAKTAESFTDDKTLRDPDPPAGAAVVASSTKAVADQRASGDSRHDLVPTNPPPGERVSPATEATANDKPTDKLPVVPVDATPSAPKETPAGIAVEYFGRTDVGLVREHNEDNFLVVNLEAQKRGIGATTLHTKIEGAGLLFAVCDGMGGAAAGEVASQMAVDTIHEMMQNGGVPRDRDHFARRLVRSIEEAGSRIFAGAKMDRSRRGMGTTATVAGLIDKTLFVGQVGDSRAYVLRGDQFALVTKDQSLVNQLIEAGQLTEEEAEAFEHSNIILQALGTTEDVTVDLTFLELRRGDRLLMCSDGLSGLVHGDMIKEVVKTSRDLIECANQLIAMANAGGGHDNITVILAEFDGTDLKVGTPEDKVAYMQYPLPPEDPKDPDPAPRATTIKSGGPKPGSDVKHDGRAMASPRPSEGGGGSNLMLLVGLLLVIVVLVGIAVMLFSGGEPEAGVPGSRTTTVSRGSEAPPAPTTNLHVLSNIDDATIYVDGVSRGALSDDMHITVTPGGHHVEARLGETVLASTHVMASAGTGSVVSLVADELPLPPTDVAPPSAPLPPEGTAIPTGADVPRDETAPPSGTAAP